MTETNLTFVSRAHSSRERARTKWDARSGGRGRETQEKSICDGRCRDAGGPGTGQRTGWPRDARGARARPQIHLPSPPRQLDSKKGSSQGKGSGQVRDSGRAIAGCHPITRAKAGDNRACKCVRCQVASRLERAGILVQLGPRPRQSSELPSCESGRRPFRLLHPPARKLLKQGTLADVPDVALSRCLPAHTSRIKHVSKVHART